MYLLVLIFMFLDGIDINVFKMINYAIKMSNFICIYTALIYKQYFV